MKFITVRDFRTTPAKIWKELGIEQELVITQNGKPIALLTPLSDSSMEETISAVRKARAVTAVKNIQEHSFQNKLSDLSLDEINKEIRETRKSKKK